MAADIELSLPHVFVAQENKDTQNNTMNADDFPIMNGNINQFDNFNTFQDVLQGKINTNTNSHLYITHTH